MPVIRNGEELANQAANRYGLNSRIFSSQIFQESGFNSTAVSTFRRKNGTVGHAYGIAQMIPETAKRLGVKNVFDPVESLDKAAKYMRSLVDKYGSYELALAAYNAGEGAVEKHKGIPPYKETQDYVKKIMSRAGQTINAGVAVVSDAAHTVTNIKLSKETTNRIVLGVATVLLVVGVLKII